MPENRQKYTRSEILRNRIIACAILSALIVIIIVAVASCGGGSKATAYTESGPNPASENTAIITGADVYDYSSPVPAGAAVADSYFANALFVGESHIGGMRTLTDAIPPARVCYSNSASVQNGIDMKLTYGSETKALSEILKDKFDSIYLQFGLNELGFQSKSAFYDYYSSLIKSIREVQPDARIYLLTVLPVSASVNAAGSYTNEAVKTYNQYISTIAAEQKLFVVDIGSAYTDDAGCLKKECTDNGTNVNYTCYNIWREYLLTHTAPDYVK